METLADIAQELEKDLDQLQYAGKTVTVKFKVSRAVNPADSRSCILLRVSASYAQV